MRMYESRLITVNTVTVLSIGILAQLKLISFSTL